MLNSRKNGKSIVRDYFEAILIAVLFALFVRTYVAQAYRIPTPSMEYNLLVGDHLLVNKFTFTAAPTMVERQLLPFNDIRRGDVVVFKFPHEQEKDYIKRVIALPRETVKIEDNQVLIKKEGDADFLPIEEPYAHFTYPDATSPFGDYGPLTIPDGEYFVMGDNRDDSLDSREWGLVPRSNIRGKAFLIYWSYELDRADTLPGSFSGRIRLGLRNLGTLFSRTRWDRTLKIVH